MKYEEEATQFYKNVNEELKKQHKTQIEMCKKINISLESFRVKLSNHSVINVFDAVKIANYLNTSVEFLVTGSSKGNKTETEKLKDKIKRIEEICKE